MLILFKQNSGNVVDFFLRSAGVFLANQKIATYVNDEEVIPRS